MSRKAPRPYHKGPLSRAEREVPRRRSPVCKDPLACCEACEGMGERFIISSPYDWHWIDCARCMGSGFEPPTKRSERREWSRAEIRELIRAEIARSASPPSAEKGGDS